MAACSSRILLEVSLLRAGHFLYLVKFLFWDRTILLRDEKMKLVSLTPEAKILLTLVHGKHTYGELKLETGLSDRWLTLKLKELGEQGIVEKAGRWYGLTKELKPHPYELSLYLGSQAERMARELAQLNFIQMIILFGGVAKKTAHQHSDIDMMMIVDKPIDKAKKILDEKISELELKFHQPIEPLILTRNDFMANVNSSEGGIIYGLAEGCQILVDKTHGELTEALSSRIREIRDNYEYLKDEGIWIKTG